MQDKGGWQNRDTAKAFADYAAVVAEHLSDRVKYFMTVNELSTFVNLGYRDGTHAPGLKLRRKELAQVAHYAVLGHGLAVEAIRAHAKPGTKVGFADNPPGTAPVIETPAHIEAAERAMREQNAMFGTVIHEGKYMDEYLKWLGADAPKFTDEEMKVIGSPLDFLGLNIYQPTYVRADSGPRRICDCATAGVFPAHVQRLDHGGAGGALLGAEDCREDLEPEGDLHHRERVLLGGCADAGRACI